jgi:regulator of protease activity HflC (stomatin/prohibitin superfamily)
VALAENLSRTGIHAGAVLGEFFAGPRGHTMTPLLITAAVVLLLALSLLAASVHLVQQYEQGVVLRFGRLQPHLRPPGLQLIVPIADRMTKVSMQTVVMGIPAQGAITKDNVTLTVDAVVYYRVIDPVKAIINVQNSRWPSPRSPRRRCAR